MRTKTKTHDSVFYYIYKKRVLWVSQSALNRARENIHSITHSHKNISSLNDLHRKICICQFFFVPLQPQSCKWLCCCYRQHKQNGIVLLNKQRLLRFVLGNSESRKFMNFQSRHGNNECLSVYVYTSPFMGELIYTRRASRCYPTEKGNARALSCGIETRCPAFYMP